MLRLIPSHWLHYVGPLTFDNSSWTVMQIDVYFKEVLLQWKYT